MDATASDADADAEADAEPDVCDEDEGVARVARLVRRHSSNWLDQRKA